MQRQPLLSAGPQPRAERSGPCTVESGKAISILHLLKHDCKDRQAFTPEGSGVQKSACTAETQKTCMNDRPALATSISAVKDRDERDYLFSHGGTAGYDQKARRSVVYGELNWST